MFGTLLGALPRPPLPDDADPSLILEAVLTLQADHGLEPLTDAGWSLAPDDPVASWRATAARTDRLVKAVLTGPYTAGLPTGSSVERWRTTLEGLAGAGCRYVEIAEPDAIRIGTDPAKRTRFRDLHDRLLDGLHDRPDLHLSLAITGGSAHEAGAATILEPPYQSLAVDLIDGPDAWYLVRATPSTRGVICGAVSTHPGSDDGPEVLLWAGAYAASSGVGGGARGPARVGLATAGSLAQLSWEAAARKVERLGHAVHLASLPAQEALAAFDPRAIDIRSAALGRYEPRRPRARHPAPPAAEERPAADAAATDDGADERPDDLAEERRAD